MGSMSRTWAARAPGILTRVAGRWRESPARTTRVRGRSTTSSPPMPCGAGSRSRACCRQTIRSSVAQSSASPCTGWKPSTTAATTSTTARASASRSTSPTALARWCGTWMPRRRARTAGGWSCGSPTSHSRHRTATSSTPPHRGTASHSTSRTCATPHCDLAMWAPSRAA